MADDKLAPLRTATALAVTASGAAQVAMLWAFDLGPTVLLVALLGIGYLLLGLGLFGTARLALALAAAGCGARALLALAPLPITDWEQLRTLVDLVVVASTATLLWRASCWPGR